MFTYEPILPAQILRMHRFLLLFIYIFDNKNTVGDKDTQTEETYINLLLVETFHVPPQQQQQQQQSPPQSRSKIRLQLHFFLCS